MFATSPLSQAPGGQRAVGLQVKAEGSQPDCTRSQPRARAFQAERYNHNKDILPMSLHLTAAPKQ